MRAPLSHCLRSSLRCFCKRARRARGAGTARRTAARAASATLQRLAWRCPTGTELAAALRKISESFLGDPCEFLLTARPSDPAYLAVIVNGQSLAAGPTTYSFDPASNKVTFLGAQCTALNASTAQNPVNVEFRIVERF